MSKIKRRDFLKLTGIGLAGAVGARFLGGAGDPGREMVEAAARSQDTMRPLNILVVVFDTLSARNMSLYGYPRQTTPNMDRLAQRAIVYHQQHAGGNFTSPGTASLLTGVYPWTHRAIHLRSEMLTPLAERSIFSFLPEQYHRFAYTQNPFAYVLLNQLRGSIDNLVKMAELADFNDVYTEALFESDYYVASESEVFLLKEPYRTPGSLFLALLDRLKLTRQSRQVLQAYKSEYPRGLSSCRVLTPSSQCFRLEPAIDWVIAQAKAAPQPFFGYLHVFPPHGPYNPRAEFARLFDDGYKPLDKPNFAGGENKSSKTINLQRRYYDQSIAHIDAEFGRLFAALEHSGVLENTALVITSDHGEMLERGVQGHVTPALYEPITHIPLLIFLPGQQARKDVYVPTSAVDVLPSLLHMTGRTLPPGLEGNILPELGVQGPTSNDIYTMDAKRNSKIGRLQKASYVLLRWPYKLIRYRGYTDMPDSDELYHLEDDPEEMTNLHTSEHPVSSELGDALEERLRQSGAR